MSIKYSVRLLNFSFAVILLFLSAFYIIQLNESIGEIEIFAFLEDNMDEQNIARLKEKLESLPQIDSVNFSPPEDVVKMWAKEAGRKKLLELIGKNPFPPLFQIKLKKVGGIKGLRRLASDIQNLKGIKMVEYGSKKTEEGIKRARGYIFIFLFIFFAALINLMNHFFVYKK